MEISPENAEFPGTERGMILELNALWVRTLLVVLSGANYNSSVIWREVCELKREE
jgi:hypothetical protein